MCAISVVGRKLYYEGTRTHADDNYYYCKLPRTEEPADHDTHTHARAHTTSERTDGLRPSERGEIEGEKKNFDGEKKTKKLLRYTTKNSRAVVFAERAACVGRPAACGRADGLLLCVAGAAAAAAAVGRKRSSATSGARERE